MGFKGRIKPTWLVADDFDRILMQFRSSVNEYIATFLPLCAWCQSCLSDFRANSRARGLLSTLPVLYFYCHCVHLKKKKQPWLLTTEEAPVSFNFLWIRAICRKRANKREKRTWERCGFNSQKGRIKPSAKSRWTNRLSVLLEMFKCVISSQLHFKPQLFHSITKAEHLHRLIFPVGCIHLG